ncbi:MAG: hypothetical protein NTV51_01545, partial [Verrucomicrobia bacterium]|nr:hypothetical protein [Verrucomicrobiota bacterium]
MQPANIYLSPPAACARLDAICARAGGTVTLVPGSAAGRVDYALPVHATAELREYLGREAAVESEAEQIGRLPGGRVFGPGIVLSPDGRAVARDVSLDFGRAPDDHWLLTYRKIRPPQPLAGPVAVVATALGEGYAHWLLEELPRWLLLGRDLGGAERAIAHTGPGFVREALAAHGWTGATIEPG